MKLLKIILILGMSFAMNARVNAVSPDCQAGPLLHNGLVGLVAGAVIGGIRVSTLCQEVYARCAKDKIDPATLPLFRLCLAVIAQNALVGALGGGICAGGVEPEAGAAFIWGAFFAWLCA